MTARAGPRAVHLVGSVPLTDEEQVFRTASGILGDRTKRLPDGETGCGPTGFAGRRQSSRTPALERVPGAKRSTASALSTVSGRARSTKLKFDGLGYADAALASYATFAQLKSVGVIASAYRFQVCLPTPLAPVM